MIHILLFLLIVAAGFFDACGDSLKDLKTHFGDAGDTLGRKGHPYRDFFHVCKYLERAALIGIGLAWPLCMRDPWACVITTACGVVIGRFVWDAVYSCPWVWLRLDERVKLRTGIKWLDKWLGIHH